MIRLQGTGIRLPCQSGHMIVTLETERLVLRPFLEEDLDALVALQGEDSFWWFPLRRGMTEEESADFLGWAVSVNADPARPVFHAVIERESGALIGWAGLSVPEFLPELLPAVEVGWRLGSDFRGNGYATEAATAALAWGFETLQLEEIVSIHEPDNVPSGRVMDRLGFGPASATVDPVRDLPLLVRRLSADDWRARSR